MKDMYLAMQLHMGETELEINNEKMPVQMKMPKGCKGILFVFETKQAAKTFWGEDVEIVKMQLKKKV